MVDELRSSLAVAVRVRVYIGIGSSSASFSLLVFYFIYDGCKSTTEALMVFMAFAGNFCCCLGMTKFCLLVAWMRSLWLPRKCSPPAAASKLYSDLIRPPLEDTIREGGRGVIARPLFALFRRHGVKVFLYIESSC